MILMIFCTFWRLKFTKVTKFRAPQMAKNGSFITFRFHSKSEWQKIAEFSTLCYGDYLINLHLLAPFGDAFQLIRLHSIWWYILLRQPTLHSQFTVHRSDGQPYEMDRVGISYGYNAERGTILEFWWYVRKIFTDIFEKKYYTKARFLQSS